MRFIPTDESPNVYLPPVSYNFKVTMDSNIAMLHMVLRTVLIKQLLLVLRN
jgi:hypothetical protein